VHTASPDWEPDLFFLKPSDRYTSGCLWREKWQPKAKRLKILMKMTKIAHYFQHLIDALGDNRGNTRLHPLVQIGSEVRSAAPDWLRGPGPSGLTGITNPSKQGPVSPLNAARTGDSISRGAIWALSGYLHYLTTRLDDYWFSLIPACNPCTSDRLSWLI
jgi:hypothetical protein